MLPSQFNDPKKYLSLMKSDEEPLRPVHRKNNLDFDWLSVFLSFIQLEKKHSKSDPSDTVHNGGCCGVDCLTFDF